MSKTHTLQASQTTAPTTQWDLDLAHSQAAFTVRHMMIANVRGTIPIKAATIVRDEHDVTRSRVSAELDVAAITTGAADRDQHLRSPDLFDAQRFPVMRFESTRIEATEDGLRIHGDLTIRDVTRPVVLDAELGGETKDPWGKHRAGLTASTVIDRRDFGLTWNVAIEAGGVLVGDKVKISLDVQAIRRER